MVATSTIIAMAVNMLLGLIIPAVLYFAVKKRFGNNRIAFFTGCGIMLVFALVLESIIHQIVLGGALGMIICSNIWLYGLYGAAMAAIFEETGRLVAFKFILKKHRDNDDTALFYGAGHGGFEAFYILFVSGINNLAISVMINSGNTETLTAGLTGSALAQVEATLAQFLEISWGSFVFSPIERIAAVILQLALSVLVWFAVKHKNYKLYGMALLFHFLLDLAAVVLNSYTAVLGTLGLVIVEAVIWILAILSAIYAKNVWKRNVNRD